MTKSNRIIFFLIFIFVLVIALVVSSCDSSKCALTVNVIPEGSGDIKPGTGVYNSGTQLELTAEPAAGFRFDYWSGNASGTQNPLRYIIRSNQLIVANFKAVFSLTVSANPINGGNVTPVNSNYDQGTSVEISATPAPGYRFSGWSGDAAGNATTITVLMDNNKYITANFIRQYSLIVTVFPVFGGTVTPIGGIYDQGANVTLTAAPSDNFAFAYWGGGAVGTSNSITVTMDGDKYISAYFSRLLTFGVTGMGNIWINFPDIVTGHYVEFTPNANGLDVAGFISDLQYSDINGNLELTIRIIYGNIVRFGNEVFSFDWKVSFYAATHDQVWVHTGRFYDIVYDDNGMILSFKAIIDDVEYTYP